MVDVLPTVLEMANVRERLPVDGHSVMGSSNGPIPLNSMPTKTQSHSICRRETRTQCLRGRPAFGNFLAGEEC
jgi:hypothetical protein